MCMCIDLLTRLLPFAAMCLCVLSLISTMSIEARTRYVLMLLQLDLRTARNGLQL
jgi:hypothetical protein